MIVHDAENPNSVGKDLEASSDWQKSSCAEKILSANDDVKPATLVSLIFVKTSICTEFGDMKFTGLS